MIVDRLTGETFEEDVYCGFLLELLYAKNPASRLFKNMIARVPLFSKLIGSYQSLPWTKAHIAPFVKKYGLDASEFEKPLEAFTSFNDFFVRKLKPQARPITAEICMPADGRYLAFPDISKSDGFFVKGQKFSLSSLLQDAKVAGDYQKGSLVIARLAPVDYHRFHFPIAGVAKTTQLINGPLFSVNPIALKQNIHRLSENKRMITHLETSVGPVLMIEVGATNVGSIHQTYAANKPFREGDEKGFFSFGGSALMLLFLPGRVELDANLVDNSRRYLETRCLMGQFLARPL